MSNIDQDTEENVDTLMDALLAAGFTHVDVYWTAPRPRTSRSVISGPGGWEFTSDTYDDNLGMTVEEALEKIRSYPKELTR